MAREPLLGGAWTWTSALLLGWGALAVACADPADDDAALDDSAGSGDSADSEDGDPDDAGADSGGVAEVEIPCSVQRALAANCTACHDAEVKFGATMPLAVLEDFRVPAVSDPTRSVAELVRSRIDDPERPMPADGSLSTADRETIVAWIDGGAVGDASEIACELDDDDLPPWGPEALPCEPDVFFTASGEDGVSAFEVPVVDDLSQCFVFDSPFDEDTQAIAWAPVVDDARVLHHWLLLEAPADTPLGPAVCTGAGGGALDAPMLMGWGPGAPNYVMPQEAGLELPGPGGKLMLQIHYNNSAGHTDVTDRSGVALCTTEEPREHAAGTLWLGSIVIDVPPGEQQVVTSDCDTSRLEEPVHVLVEWPHMHAIGTSLKTELISAGTGDVTPLVDIGDWNFAGQAYYPHDPAVRIEPGDVLRTTCTYDNDTNQPIRWGEASGDEMCFDFATVYPITAFDTPNGRGPATQGRFCMDFG